MTVSYLTFDVMKQLGCPSLEFIIYWIQLHNLQMELNYKNKREKHAQYPLLYQKQLLLLHLLPQLWVQQLHFLWEEPKLLRQMRYISNLQRGEMLHLKEKKNLYDGGYKQMHLVVTLAFLLSDMTCTRICSIFFKAQLPYWLICLFIQHTESN